MPWKFDAHSPESTKSVILLFPQTNVASFLSCLFLRSKTTPRFHPIGLQKVFRISYVQIRQAVSSSKLGRWQVQEKQYSGKATCRSCPERTRTRISVHKFAVVYTRSWHQQMKQSQNIQMGLATKQLWFPREIVGNYYCILQHKNLPLPRQN